LNNLKTQDYNYQFEYKKNSFKSFFSSHTPNINYFKSPANGFRTRAEFGVLFSKNILNYTMVRNGKKYTVTKLVICHKRINSLMALLKECLEEDSYLTKKLFQIEFQVSRNNEAIITMIYHKKPPEEWQDGLMLLSSKLNSSIILRSKRYKDIIGKDFVLETYTSGQIQFDLYLFEQCFSQPNPFICDQMLSWVAMNFKSSKDILELYCGVGTFTVPLSYLCKRLLATENNRKSLKGLTSNLLLNKIENVITARLSGQETLDAINGLRDFRRLSHLDLKTLDIDTVFLDPPRDGLQENMLEEVKKFSNIIYISCGFKSLQKDIKILSKTHKVVKAAMFDQFPYTDHLESGVILETK